jgi:hypothetical protein
MIAVVLVCMSLNVFGCEADKFSAAPTAEYAETYGPNGVKLSANVY